VLATIPWARELDRSSDERSDERSSGRRPITDMVTGAGRDQY